MAISLLNNIAALAAQNQLQITQGKLQSTLFQLSSGSRINSGADDAAGLAIANGLQANITALTQSGMNASSGVGSLQVADGALAQVTTLLNRAVTLAAESANGTYSTQQRQALDAEYTQIKAEIDSIGTNTNYNGAQVFSATQQSVFLSDGVSNSTITMNTGALSSDGILGAKATGTITDTSALAAGVAVAGDSVTIGTTAYTFVANNTAAPTATQVKIGATGADSLTNLAAAVNANDANVTATLSATQTVLTFTAKNGGTAGNSVALVATIPGSSPLTASGATLGTGTGQTVGAVAGNLTTVALATTSLNAITSAIASVASMRGGIGANINRLQAASNVENVQVQNLTAAEDQIMAANIPQQVTNLSEYSILNQSGISALAQANSAQQTILKLLQ
jgi:flagellin